jgi:hypothetical protein
MPGGAPTAHEVLPDSLLLLLTWTITAVPISRVDSIGGRNTSLSLSAEVSKAKLTCET